MYLSKVLQRWLTFGVTGVTGIKKPGGTLHFLFCPNLLIILVLREKKKKKLCAIRIMMSADKIRGGVLPFSHI